MKRVLISMAALIGVAIAPSAASAQDAADITLVHGIPGATVDVSVNGTVVIDGFKPGSLANLSSFAGQTLTNVEVTDDASGTSLIGPVASLEVPATGSWSIVAHLDADGTAVLNSFENNTAAAADGKGRVTVRHTAAAPAVDLIVGSDRPITGAVNGDSNELELDAGDLSGAQLAPTGDAAIAQLGTTTISATTNTIIYAVGSVTDDTIDFVVQTVNLDVDASTTTTTVAGATTTTVAGATTTTVANPTAVNTGSPIDGGSNTLLLVVLAGGLMLAGGAFVARRRI